MGVIHHIRLAVSDFDRAMEFYSPILSWLGFQKMELSFKEDVPRAGFLKKDDKDDLAFLISQARVEGRHTHDQPGIHHIAFAVDTREDVNRFYDEVLTNMSAIRIEDPPVECPEYAEGYYATFFFDPDGIKLEVVCFHRKPLRWNFLFQP